jgi:HEAT repeat protein/energy-coupling factor transporter ATP-binding protein EcfA2
MRKEDRTYGEDNQERSRRVLEILLRYCDTGIEKGKIKCSKKDLRVTFEISRADLTNLVKEKYTTSNWESDIAPVVSHYLKWLGILQDNRTVTKGSRTWKFSLNLWCDDLEGNLKQFQNEWTKKAPDRSKQKQADSLSSSVEGRSPKQENKINWRSACKAQLERQKQQITSSPLHRKARDLDSVHVPLGLVERKERPKVDRTLEISPERGSAAGQQEYTEKRVEHEAFLAEIGKRQPGEHLVILGEPGAGKTTLLTKVWEWLLDHEQPGEDIIVAWVPLAAVKNNELEEYLHKSWIKQFCKSGEIDRYWASFEALADAGRVWLLLDGADEMGGEALRKLEVTLREAWARSTRAIITCRLNLWDASSHKLQTNSNFQVYRTLDFKYVNPARQDEVKGFIDNWFRSTPVTGQKLRMALDEGGKERIKDLAKNPLRLSLLCDIWEEEDVLPDTQADLYQKFVNRFYKWSKFPELLKRRERLNRLMQGLAKYGLNKPSLRFRFTEAELQEQLIEEEHLDALKALGWLNCVGADESDDEVYAFFHPTFQEYFAACGINHWDYFLPKAHVDQPVPCIGEDEPTYRVFESEWRQPIMLWFGRGDIADEDKEKFIEKLTTFQDGVSSFYYYHAYCMGAIGVGEFKSSKYAEEVVQQIMQWAFGHFNTDNQEWMIFLEPILSLARDTIPFTNRGYAMKALTNVLCDPNLDILHRTDVAKALGEIGVGNESAIKALIDLLYDTNMDDSFRSNVVEALGKIGVGNESVIKALIDLLYDTNMDDSFRSNVVDALGEIGVGNESAIKALIDLLYDTNMDDSFRSNVVDALGEIGVGNESAIKALIDLLHNTNMDDSFRVYCVAKALWKIGLGHESAIKALFDLLRDPSIDYIHKIWVSKKIGLGNESIIKALTHILSDPNLTDLIHSHVVKALEKIALKNLIVIDTLEKLLCNSSLDSWHCFRVAVALGKLDAGNTIAIQSLINLLNNSSLTKMLRFHVAVALGKLDAGNAIAIQSLINLLSDSDFTDNKDNRLSRDNRLSVAIALGKLDMGNMIAIQALTDLLCDLDFRFMELVTPMGTMGWGNSEIIATLIYLLGNDKSDNTNLKDSLQSVVMEILKGIDVREDSTIIEALTDLLGKFNRDDPLRFGVIDALGLLLSKATVIRRLKDNITDEAHNANFEVFHFSYKNTFKHTKALSYTEFYAIWNYNL